MSRRLRLRPSVLVPSSLVATLAVVAGCSSSPGNNATSSATGGSYPVVLDDCGTTVRVDAPPQRVVTIKSSTTELLLALGLGDRIVGRAYPDGPLPDDLASTTTAPVIADKVPGAEAVLALEPDFVYAGWESNLTADGAGDRGTLAGLGVATYVSPAACREPGYQPDPLTFDDVWAEIGEVGTIFGVSDAADALVAQQKAALAAVTPVADGQGDRPTVLWYSSASDTPYVGAGIGAPQMIMDAAGLDNVFADVHDSWTSVGWEDVVARDPDVIVLVDAQWSSAEKKIGILEENPATAQLTAVREHRYLVVPFAATEAGVRNVEAVTSLVEQYQALG